METKYAKSEKRTKLGKRRKEINKDFYWALIINLSDLEGVLTTSKSLIDFESPEDVLVLTENVYQTVIENFTESLSITESDNIYDLQVATWGSSNYSSRGVGVTPQGKVYTSG